MNALLLGLVALALLLFSGLFSGCEMGLYCLNRIRLRLRSEEEQATNARLLLRLTERQGQSVLSILLWQNVAGYLTMLAATAWLAEMVGQDSPHVEFYAAALLSPLVFALGDVVPKNWFRIEADRLMYPVARLIYVSVALIRWTRVTTLLEQIPRLLARLVAPEDSDRWDGPRGDVVGLLREGAAEGALTEEQTQIVERVLGLSSIRVGSFMIPRRRVLTVPADASEQLFRLVVRRHPFAHLPVLTSDRRMVLGVVNVNEVLADAQGYSLQRHLQSAIEVHAGESAAKALVQLQRAQVTLAIVVDPRRGFVGIITLTDIVEEIFGT